MFFGVFSEKSVLQSMKDTFPYFSYNFALHIEVFIHVEIIFIHGVRCGSDFFVCFIVFSFPS